MSSEYQDLLRQATTPPLLVPEGVQQSLACAAPSIPHPAGPPAPKSNGAYNALHWAGKTVAIDWGRPWALKSDTLEVDGSGATGIPAAHCTPLLGQGQAMGAKTTPRASLKVCRPPGGGGGKLDPPLPTHE